MRNVRRSHGPHEFETVQIVADSVEQALAAPQQRRNEMDFHLVDEPRGQILRSGIRTAGKRYVLAAGGSSSLIERRSDGRSMARRLSRPPDARRTCCVP